MTLGELLAAVPPATYVFITVEYASAARAEGTIYGPRERLNIPPRIEAALVTRLYKDYPAIIKTAGLNGFTASKPTTDTTPTLKTIKAGPMSAGDYKKHTAALTADGIAWEDC